MIFGYFSTVPKQAQFDMFEISEYANKNVFLMTDPNAISFRGPLSANFLEISG